MNLLVCDNKATGKNGFLSFFSSWLWTQKRVLYSMLGVYHIHCQMGFYCTQEWFFITHILHRSLFRPLANPDSSGLKTGFEFVAPAAQPAFILCTSPAPNTLPASTCLKCSHYFANHLALNVNASSRVQVIGSEGSPVTARSHVCFTARPSRLRSVAVWISTLTLVTEIQYL